MHFVFGDCILDTARRELIRAGQVVHLPQKAFRLLEVLIERRPAALSKGELMELVWPGVFVSEANLSSLIADLRTATGDDARAPRLVRTVHGFGYAFDGEVRVQAVQPAETAVCRLLWGAREIALNEGDNIIGRTRDAVVWIDDREVSRRHARIIVAGERAMLEDLGSKNGTEVNGKRVRGAVQLADHDVIKVGPASMTVRVLSSQGSTATALSRRESEEFASRTENNNRVHQEPHEERRTARRTKNDERPRPDLA